MSETAWLVLLFLAGLFGFVTLILVCGIQSRELERREDALDGAPADAARPRSFFATLGAAFDPPPEVSPAAIGLVEADLRRQCEEAARFVARPSIHSLQLVAPVSDGQADRPALRRLRRFLEAETRIAREFVSEPTLDRLQGRLAHVA